MIRPKLEKIADYFTKTYGMETPEDPKFSALELLSEFNNIKSSSVVTYKNIEKVFPKYRGSKLKVRYLGWLPRGVDCLTPLEREEFDSTGESIYLPLTYEELKRQNFIQVKIDLDVKKERLLIALEELITLWQEMRHKVTNQRGSRVRLQSYDIYLRIWDLHKQGNTVSQIAEIMYPRYDKSTPIAGKKKRHYDANENLISAVRKQLAAVTELIECQYRKIK